MNTVKWLSYTLTVMLYYYFKGGGAVNVSPNPKYTFEQCLVSKTSLGYCVGVSALSKLQSIDNDPAFDIVDGVTFIRDEQRPRSVSNFFERDPQDFGGILDSMSHVISHRTLRWDMSTLYPGLLMRVTPSIDGVLEFVMDPLQEDLALKASHGHFKEVGTARALARTFLLPFLLGFKFKVATLIPLFFGILALLAKKALFVSKIALVFSSSLALSSLLFGSNTHSTPSLHYGHHHFGHHGFGGGGGHHHHHHGIPAWNLHQGLYKTEDTGGEIVDNTFKGFKEEGQDQLKFSQPLNVISQFDRGNDGRNFAWNDSDKNIKA